MMCIREITMVLYEYMNSIKNDVYYLFVNSHVRIDIHRQLYPLRKPLSQSKSTIVHIYKWNSLFHCVTSHNDDHIRKYHRMSDNEGQSPFSNVFLEQGKG
jgi:hypothetical protein